MAATNGVALQCSGLMAQGESLAAALKCPGTARQRLLADAQAAADVAATSTAVTAAGLGGGGGSSPFDAAFRSFFVQDRDVSIQRISMLQGWV